MRSQIEKYFDKEIDKIFKDKMRDHREVVKFIKNHERKHICIDNILKEIKQIEITQAVKLDKEKIKFISKSLAQTFAKVALQKQEDDMMSETARIAKQRKIQEMDDLEAELNESVVENDRSEEI